MGARTRAGGSSRSTRVRRAVFPVAVAGLLAPLTVGPAQAANDHANHHAVCPAEPAAVHCHARVVTDSQGNPAAAVTPAGYGPADLRAAYGLLSTGSGAQTIAIVDAYDDPKIESDLAVYSSQYGLPECSTVNGCLTKVNQTGGKKYPRADAGWALEIALDVETAHGICPGCHILLVEAASNGFPDLLAAEDYATTVYPATGHATVVSNSWGAGEFPTEATYDAHFTHPGVPITVSSGDNGYGVEYPAASPNVTAVGGTTLRKQTGTARGWTESAWSGAGSGCSTYELKQQWQTDTGCATGRTVADVSADADPATGAAVYDSVRYQGRAGWFQVGGTSLSAPLIAAVYALAGNEAIVTNGSYPYNHATSTSLWDVTSGANGSCGGSYLCTAVTGYDGPTGLGTPQGTNAF